MPVPDDADPLEALRRLRPEERRAFCGRVVEHLSELMEGTADEELRREVQELLGRCRPYLTVRETLAATVRELGGLGRAADGLRDDPDFLRCVDAVRRRLATSPPEGD